MLSVSTVSGILTAQNFSMPAGYINDDDGVRYMVSVGEEFSSAEELSDLVLFDLGIDGVEPDPALGRRDGVLHGRLRRDLYQAQRRERHPRLVHEAVDLRHGGGLQEHQRPL